MAGRSGRSTGRVGTVNLVLLAAAVIIAPWRLTRLHRRTLGYAESGWLTRDSTVASVPRYLASHRLEIVPVARNRAGVVDGSNGRLAMSVQLIGGSLMLSDQTEHRAKSVGDGRWVVSYLPGRTLDTQQATAAMQVAEITTYLESWARLIGLTGLEAAGMAIAVSAAASRHHAAGFGRAARC